MEQTVNIREFSKSQTVRIYDILYVGPLLIYAGTFKSNLPNWVKASLVITGVLTIGYNAHYYMKNRKELNSTTI